MIANNNTDDQPVTAGIESKVVVVSKKQSFI